MGLAAHVSQSTGHIERHHALSSQPPPQPSSHAPSRDTNRQHHEALQVVGRQQAITHADQGHVGDGHVSEQVPGARGLRPSYSTGSCASVGQLAQGSASLISASLSMWSMHGGSHSASADSNVPRRHSLRQSIRDAFFGKSRHSHRTSSVELPESVKEEAVQRILGLLLYSIPQGEGFLRNGNAKRCFNLYRKTAVDCLHIAEGLHRPVVPGPQQLHHGNSHAHNDHHDAVHASSTASSLVAGASSLSPRQASTASPASSRKEHRQSLPSALSVASGEEVRAAAPRLSPISKSLSLSSAPSAVAITPARPQQQGSAHNKSTSPQTRSPH
eukprot:Opistho-2@62374